VGNILYQRGSEKTGAVVRSLESAIFAIGHDRTAFDDVVATVDEPDFVVVRKCAAFGDCSNAKINFRFPYHGPLFSFSLRERAPSGLA
jgi:hypothetical protein